MTISGQQTGSTSVPAGQEALLSAVVTSTDSSPVSTFNLNGDNRSEALPTLRADTFTASNEIPAAASDSEDGEESEYESDGGEGDAHEDSEYIPQWKGARPRAPLVSDQSGPKRKDRNVKSRSESTKSSTRQDATKDESTSTSTSTDPQVTTSKAESRDVKSKDTKTKADKPVAGSSSRC